MKKQILLFATLFWCCLLSFGQNFTSGGINFRVIGSTAPLKVAVAAHTAFTGTAIIPETVTNAGITYIVDRIDTSAFYNRSGLTSITFPNTLVAIGPSAFQNCTGLTNITIPNSVTSLGIYAFQNCSNLSTIVLSNNLTQIPERCFRYCTALTTINIPSNVTSISNLSFTNCTSLNSVTILGGTVNFDTPNPINGLAGAFDSCSALTSFTINVTTPPTIAAGVFGSVTLANATLRVPAASLSAYNAASVWSSFGTRVAIATTPPAPTAATPQIFCGVTSQTLSNVVVTGEPGAIFKWYYTAIGPDVAPATEVFTGASNYFVTQTVNGLESPRTSVFMNVVNDPRPSTTNQSFCGTPTIANLVATGDNLKWYLTTSGGSPLAANTALLSTVYFVTQTVNGCESSRTGALVSVNPIPLAPTASAQSFCGNATVADLVASASNIRWYTSPSGGSPLDDTTALTTATYYVSQIGAGGCESARTAVAVNVGDTTNPVVIAKNITANLNAAGSVFIDPNMINNGSTDNCGIAGLQINDSSSTIFTCANLGTNTVVLKAVDLNGNVATANAVVTVVDNTNPTAIAQNIAVNLNASGVVSVTPNMINLGSFDNCGIASFQINDASGAMFTCANVGLNFVVLKVIDFSGNMATANASVFVNGTPAPTASNQNFCGTPTVANLVAIGDNLKWYTTSTSGSPLATSASLTTTTYYVSQTENTCESSRTAVAVVVTPLPDAPVYNPTVLCSADNPNLTSISTNAVNKKFYANAVGGIALPLSTLLVSGTTYYVTETVGNCESARTPFTPIINTSPNGAFTNVSNTFTAVESNPNATYDWKRYGFTGAYGTEGVNQSITITNFDGPGYELSVTLNGCTTSTFFTPLTILGSTFCPNTTTWGEDGWSNGEPNATKSAIFASDYTATDNLTACSVEVSANANVIFPSNFNLTVTNSVNVDVNGSLTFESNSNLIQVNAATNTGNIIYKRNASMNRLDYVYWSSPVANQKLLAFSPNTLPNRFYSYNEPTKLFVQVASPSTTNFELAKGYSLRAPNNFVQAPAPPQTFVGIFTGVPNNGNVFVPVTFTASPTGGIGFNLIGNPYPSTVNATDFLNENAGSLYFWTHQSYYDANNVLVNGGVNNYATFNLSGAVAASITNGVNVAPNGFIQAGQGFMYLTATNKNVLFTNLMRTANNDGQFFRTAQTAVNDKLWLNLTNNNASSFSQTMLAYLPDTTSAFDDGYDAKQINTGNVLSSKIDSENYAIQSRGNFVNSDVVKLNLNLAESGSFTLSNDHATGIFNQSQDYFLKDNLLGTVHNIKQSPYNFVANAGATANRFEIVYQSALSNNNNVFVSENVIVFEQNGLLNISSTDDLKSVKVFDVQGRNIFEAKDINSKVTTLNGFRPQQQVLLLQITNSENQVVTKKVVF